MFRTPAFEQFQVQVVPNDLIATEDKFKTVKIQPTDRVVFPSLLINFIGSGRNYPVLRNGAIALIPDEKVPLNYRVGAKDIKTEQSVFFVNATSMPGASGSPVFLDPGPRISGQEFSLGTQPLLLGVMHGFFPAMPREILDVETTAKKQFFQENSGIAVVFPAWRIREIMDSEPFQKRIKEIEEQIRKSETPKAP